MNRRNVIFVIIIAFVIISCVFVGVLVFGGFNFNSKKAEIVQPVTAEHVVHQSNVSKSNCTNTIVNSDNLKKTNRSAKIKDSQKDDSSIRNIENVNTIPLCNIETCLTPGNNEKIQPQESESTSSLKTAEIIYNPELSKTKQVISNPKLSKKRQVTSDSSEIHEIFKLQRRNKDSETNKIEDNKDNLNSSNKELNHSNTEVMHIQPVRNYFRSTSIENSNYSNKELNHSNTEVMQIQPVRNYFRSTSIENSNNSNKELNHSNTEVMQIQPVRNYFRSISIDNSMQNSPSLQPNFYNNLSDDKTELDPIENNYSSESNHSSSPNKINDKNEQLEFVDLPKADNQKLQDLETENPLLDLYSTLSNFATKIKNKLQSYQSDNCTGSELNGEKNEENCEDDQIINFNKIKENGTRILNYLNCSR